MTVQLSLEPFQRQLTPLYVADAGRDYGYQMK
jgi:hypothetical protein